MRVLGDGDVGLVAGLDVNDGQGRKPLSGRRLNNGLDVLEPAPQAGEVHSRSSHDRAGEAWRAGPQVFEVAGGRCSSDVFFRPLSGRGQRSSWADIKS